jgi:hypothetical protein
LGKLVWLASYPKSGSTWLRAFLHNYIREPASPYDINSLMDLSIGESGASLYRPYDPRPASQYSIADVQRMRPLVHRDLMGLHPDLVFVKTHNASLAVHGVPLVTPEVTAGAIYVVRDPRDVAISFAQHAGRTIDEMIAFMANPDAAGGGTDHTVYERFSSWSVHVHYWTRNPNPRLLVLRYEDMLARPAEVFGDVIRFLGQEPPPARLGRAIDFSSFAELSAQERAAGFAERPSVAVAPFFRAGRAGQWREVLSGAQSTRIEQAHGPMMQLFKYL